MFNTPICFIVLLAISLMSAGACGQAAQENLVQKRAYQSVPVPNYWGWKGPQHGDRGQLTDGAVADAWSTSAGETYTLPISMGWNAVDPVVVFDLGESRDIGGVGIHSFNSPWGPWWPEKLAVLVSDDNVHFHLACDPMTTSPASMKPALSPKAVQAGIDRKMSERGISPSAHWYRTPEFKAKGRYVALLMTRQPTTGSIVTTEIEIYPALEKGDATEHSEPTFTEGEGGWKSFKLYQAINERVTRDIDALKKQIQQSQVSASQELLGRLAELQTKLLAQPVPVADSFRAIFPVNDVHRQVFAVQAELWRLQGAPPLQAWKTHRWDPMVPIQSPATAAEVRLQIDMAQNEFRSDVLNLSNSTDKPMEVTLRLKDLPVESVDLFEVPLVDTHSFEPVASALVPAKEADGAVQLTIPSGLSAQVWLRCSSKNLSAGEYKGTVQIVGPGDLSIDVPMAINVASVRLPDKLSLYLGGWDYPFAGMYQVTAENLKPYVAMLKEYGVNVTWAGDILHMATYDSKGNVTKPPDRTEFDAWIAAWPDADLYCAVASATPGRPEEKVAAWAKDWSQYMESRGILPERVALLILDEPTTVAEFDAILAAGRTIKKAEPRFKIFNDIHLADPTQGPPVLQQVMTDACDIQCSEVWHMITEAKGYATYMKQHARPDLTWWCYSAGSSHRLTDPYLAFNLRGWFCFANGMNGASWWAFCDGSGFSWNEYLNGSTAYSALYLDKDSVTASKSMEAMREGAQDYELLKMAQEKLSAERTSQAGLNRDIQRVLGVHQRDRWLWKVKKDRSTADEVRVRTMRLLEGSEQP